MPFQVLVLLLAGVLVNADFAFAKASIYEQLTTLVGRPTHYYSELDILKAQNQSQNKFIRVAYNNCTNDFFQVSGVRLSTTKRLKNMISNQDPSVFSEEEVAKFSVKGPIGKGVKDFDGIKLVEWAPTDLKGYLKSFEKVEYVDIATLDLNVPLLGRADDLNPKEANFKIRVDARGIDRKSKKRRHDTSTWTIRSFKDGDRWKFAQVSVDKGQTLLASREPYFRDVTKDSGLDKVAIYPRTEAIRRGGYALSVVDVNSDGIQDVFVGLRDETELWLGTKAGSFIRSASSLDSEKYVKTAVFADFNNDGFQDVVINRFLDIEQRKRSPDVAVVMFNGTKGGEFILNREAKFGDPSAFREPMPSSVGDFNKDGYLDLYVGFPGLKDFSNFRTEEEVSKKGTQGLYFNNRKNAFNDSTTPNLIPSYSKRPMSYQTMVFPHSALSLDFDQDGDLDLIAIDDRNHLSPIYVNKGSGQFQLGTKDIGIENIGYGMTIASGDVDNNGRTDLAISNINFSEYDVYSRLCARNWKRKADFSEKGLVLYRANEKKFDEVSDQLSLVDPGQGVAGIAFLDYNNDGYQDIYVSNGLWSGSPEGDSLDDIFSIALMSKVKRYVLRLADSINFMSILQTMSGEIPDRTTLKIAKSDSRPSLAGYQRNRLYRNNGDGTFTDVAYIEGVDSIADGYIVGRIDYDRDGRTDLMLRNADPGDMKYSFPPVQLFKNNSPSRKSVRFTFEGVASPRDAIGLFAIARFRDGRKQVQHLEGNSGALQQERMLSYGLGKLTSMASLEIHWPSGTVQTLKNIKPGIHHVREPSATKQITRRTSKKPEST